MSVIEDPRAGARTHRRRTTAATAAGAVLLVLGAAGCSFSGSVDDATSKSSASASDGPTTATTSSSSTPAPSTSSTGSPTSSSTAAPTTSTTGSPTASSQPAGQASSTACRTADLAVSVVPDPGGASAGHQHLLVRFTNSGRGTCVLDGHPGVSLVAGDDGHQVGAAAAREGSPTAVRLAPGATAQAALSVAQAGDYDAGQCQPTAVRGVRVYPPDQTASAFVAVDGLTGCSAASVVLLLVDPVEAA